MLLAGRLPYKTTMSLATLELIPNAYPAVVLSPGHMVNKWAREVREVIPGARGIVVDSLKDLRKVVQNYRKGEKVVVVLSKERAKLGSGWQPATIQRRRKLRITKPDPTDKAKNIEAIETITAHTCPKCGAIVRDEDGLPLLQLPPKRLFCTARVKQWVGDSLDNTAGTFKETKCNAPLYTSKGFRRFPLSRFIRTKLRGFFKVFICDEVHMFKGKATDQASAYHDLIMATKYTINLTGTLFGGKSTDLFWLRHRIDPNVRRDFEFQDEIRWAGMYGRLEHTLQEDEADEDGKFSGRRRHNVKTKELPGVSPALFSRLLTSCIFVRITDLGWQLPPYDETVINLSLADAQATQYNALYETLLSYIKVKRSASDYEHQVARKLLGVWLQTCLGRPNADFRPETVMYRVNKQLKLPVPIDQPMPLTGIADPDEPDLIANHLACVPKGVIKKDDLVIENYGEYALQLAPVVAEGELLPKEEWLASYCQHEQRQKRKVLLYVRQTGTRDIQPRLQQILQSAGLTAVILPDKVEPKDREAWINQRVHEMDVLITNPRKVETGLDLIQFATCIFFELDYSLYTLWQAMRRVWRLGQTRPVKVLFPVYRGTVEAAALALMGRKMQAALLLYGDNASSAITDEAGDASGDFTAELAARLLAGEQLETNGITGLLKVAFTAQDEGLADLPTPAVATVEARALDQDPAENLFPKTDPDDLTDLSAWPTWLSTQETTRILKRLKATTVTTTRRQQRLITTTEAATAAGQLSLFGG